MFTLILTIITLSNVLLMNMGVGTTNYFTRLPFISSLSWLSLPPSRVSSLLLNLLAASYIL